MRYRKAAKIRRRVVIPAVGLLNDQRLRLALSIGIPFKENAFSPIVFYQQAPFVQLFDDLGQKGIVKGFSPFCEVDIQPIVNLLELPPRLFAQQLPRFTGVLVSPLQFHHRISGGGFKSVVFVEPQFRFLVERHQIADIQCIGGGEGIGIRLAQVGNQHPKLGSPNRRRG